MNSEDVKAELERLRYMTELSHFLDDTGEVSVTPQYIEEEF